MRDINLPRQRPDGSGTVLLTKGADGSCTQSAQADASFTSCKGSTNESRPKVGRTKLWTKRKTDDKDFQIPSTDPNLDLRISLMVSGDFRRS
jgi:hypothetical protein